MEDLFGFDKERDFPEIEWSYSRRGALEQCPLKYYFQYYGGLTKLAKKENRQEQIVLFKKFSNRFTRTGEILHLVVRTYLKDKGNHWSLDRLQKWAGQMLKEDIDFSTQKQSGEKLNDKQYPPVVLVELWYGHEHGNQLIDETKARLMDAINLFVSSDIYSELRSFDQQIPRVIEKKVRYQVSDIHCRAQVDLAYREKNDSTVVICDWKTGDNNDPESGLQLQSYALWAIDEFKCSPKELKLLRAHLSENKLKQYEVTTKTLDRASARIRQDMERMRLVHTYGIEAASEAFTPCLQPQVCRLCSFQELCSLV